MIRGGKVIIMHGKWIEERLKLLLTQEKVGHNVLDNRHLDDTSRLDSLQMTLSSSKIKLSTSQTPKI